MMCPTVKYTFDFIARDGKCLAFVAFSNKKPIGYILTINNRWPTVIFIEIVEVEKDFRNRGIGMRLIEEVEKVAMANNIESLRLIVYDKDAKRLYNRLGFKRMPDSDDIRWEKKLKIVGRLQRLD